MIQRYTKGKFGRIEKDDGGEFVYFINHDEVVNKKYELIDKLSKNNETLYEQLNKSLLDNGNLLCSKKVLLDKHISLKLLTKKYEILAWLFLIIDFILITKLAL